MPQLVPTSEDTRIYEWCVLYPYPLTQKEEQQLIKEVEGHFEEVGAKLVAKDAWGRRGLAYAVGGFKEGNFTVYYYEMDPAKVKEVDNALRITKGVLRHITVKPPKHYQVVKFSEAYEAWLKDRKTVEEQRASAREEKVQEQIARKAKMKAKATAERKKTVKPAERPLEEEAITEQIDKLISDDTLDI
ncbi:MAG: 30S ribosomal protein S6 [Candidatus Peribacteraceae bacterium]|jgi:ribosomal protein S6